MTNTASRLGPWGPCIDSWISCAPFERLLGMEILNADSGRATLTMPFTEHHAQGAGFMHGGALVSLADTAVAMAIKSLLPEGSNFLTMEMNARFLKAVTQGIITAEAETEHLDERTLRGLAHLYDHERDKVFHFEAVFRIPKKSRS